MKTKTYQQAIECLNSLQSNAATIAASQSASASASRRSQTLHDMELYLSKMGYKPSDLNRLNVLHITGTKGKGSTTAFVSSLLQSLNGDARIGLYTSPHLVAVRERIRINGQPLTEERFTQYFFDVWNSLDSELITKEGDKLPPKPAYFRFMTLMAFHTFLKEDVDATVLEVGIGGTLDCTNIVPGPTVAAVSSLGLDHTALLGNSIREIAQNKGGIYKQGATAISVPQPQDGLEVLRTCAESVQAPFSVVDTSTNFNDVQLGLKGHHQILNARLAVQVVKAFVSSTRNDKYAHWKQTLENHDWKVLPEIFKHGLANARWPGRCQTVHDPRRASTTWYLDGSHTTDSLVACMNWFGEVLNKSSTPSTSSKPHRYLIFNCTKGRSATELLSVIVDSLKSVTNSHADSIFDTVIFCTNVTYTSGQFASDLTSVNVDVKALQELNVQHELKSVWHNLLPHMRDDRVKVLPSIEAAVKCIDEDAGSSQEKEVLVCGSLHLVGGVIEVAQLADVAL
ncbi:hypothetical protein E3P99_00493 [Wallemia hederae]|uniref:Folylpolyglutamate synthase n=1 Tax=Wallemia hederae TaxID=1540922 RepID=A0A4T0FV04_9BASI|nr:hypothetical protein E3P99_00493 [Wallemia hederae]